MNQLSAKHVEQQIKNNKKVTLIDVREPEEVAAGKIPGVINIPLGLLEYRLHELKKSEEYIIVCRSGSRSGLATSFLESRGYNATNMSGGMISWEGAVEIAGQYQPAR
ncbi:rhodanese-like domain-containing protein [Salipaludibacillus aurantiacus]|uniref:Rhodanese-related sulfurtransferase n=1 Tax=Salipaludibacillus aurantiacus TaxID=1601833 RepID=A0A1H9U8D0_9BACI|nr:rhodanese-like domain-containing protein [Salipaludibacillus aurantiacus]SES05521.1 Rhodanese-related sulfurtransferase [Salipaludibacillus aurantiacus]